MMKLTALVFAAVAALSFSSAQARPLDNETVQKKLAICGAIYYDHFAYGDAFSRKHCLENIVMELADDGQGRELYDVWGSLENDNVSPKFSCAVALRKAANGKYTAKVELCVDRWL